MARRPENRQSKWIEAAPPQALKTLPDYLENDLDIVFIGLNPGLYSARIGHYYANKANRFWKALSASGLVPEPVGPQDDAHLLSWGIGLTDIVKRPTRGIDELSRAEFRRGAETLHKKIARYAPRNVCFNGLVGYRLCCGNDATLGDRTHHFAGAHAFGVPSTSPRNARYTLDDLVSAFRNLRELKAALENTARPTVRTDRGVKRRRGRGA